MLNRYTKTLTWQLLTSANRHACVRERYIPFQLSFRTAICGVVNNGSSISYFIFCTRLNLFTNGTIKGIVYVLHSDALLFPLDIGVWALQRFHLHAVSQYEELIQRTITIEHHCIEQIMYQAANNSKNEPHHSVRIALETARLRVHCTYL